MPLAFFAGSAFVALGWRVHDEKTPPPMLFRDVLVAHAAKQKAFERGDLRKVLEPLNHISPKPYKLSPSTLNPKP